jgi:hypothetical protein
MSEEKKTIENVTNSEYKWGFVSNIEEDAFPKGLNEDVDWHKEELYAVCIPNDPKVLENIDKAKHLPQPNPGFFVL